MSRLTDDLLDSGVSLAAAGESAAKVFAQISEIEADDVYAEAWEKVASVAAGMYGGPDETEVQLGVAEFAGMLRRAFARATGYETEIPPIADLPVQHRLAWEGVARHLANVCGMEVEDVRRIETHEGRIVAMMRHRLGLTTT